MTEPGIIAWRADVITGGGWLSFPCLPASDRRVSDRFKAAAYAAEWYHRARAECAYTWTTHTPPAEDCTCGYHACTDIRAVAKFSSHNSDIWDDGVALAITRVRLSEGVLPGRWLGRAFEPDPPTTVRGLQMDYLGPVLTNGNLDMVRHWQWETGFDVRQIRPLCSVISARGDEPEGWWREYPDGLHEETCSRPPRQVTGKAAPGWGDLECPECEAQSSSNLEWRIEHRLVLESDVPRERATAVEERLQ